VRFRNKRERERERVDTTICNDRSNKCYLGKWFSYWKPLKGLKGLDRKKDVIGDTF